MAPIGKKASYRVHYKRIRAIVVITHQPRFPVQRLSLSEQLSFKEARGQRPFEIKSTLCQRPILRV